MALWYLVLLALLHDLLRTPHLPHFLLHSPHSTITSHINRAVHSQLNSDGHFGATATTTTTTPDPSFHPYPAPKPWDICERFKNITMNNKTLFDEAPLDNDVRSHFI